ncbi:MAG TPA: xanthine dehydrogenase family protein molybdopterin-binding subunit [Burkholderiales bacterium]|nr:xanthine dehydrogenase family protein molybdopterin-binding subunit [Burkholderiales bacterium]
MKTAFKPSRRNFLKTSGLVIGFTLPAATRLAQAATPAEFKPSAYLRVGADDRVTVVVGLSEMGQGVHTAIPQLVAEELDADWTRVRVEQAPVDQAFNNPIFGIQATGGSTSVNGHWEPMRKAGAAAREMLVAAAAQSWKVDASECRTEKGAVVHKSGKKLSYGKLVAAAAKQPVPKEPKLKDATQFKIIGQSLRRLDTPHKVNGSGKYGMDVRLPGMLTAVLAHPPAPGGKAVSVDDSKAKEVKGVRQVIQIPQGVAVLADGYWQAKKGRDALQIQWDKGANAGLSSDGVSKMLTEATQQEGKVARNEGNVGSASGAKTFEAVYEAPYLAHACMEPMNAAAWVKKDGIEVWAGTQSQGPNQGILSHVAAVDPKQVKVNTMLLGGGFGRRFAPDFTIAATLLSKMSGKPVKLVYSREDDMRAYFYRPASVTRFTAALDTSGAPVAFSARVASPSIMEASGFMKLPPDGVDTFAVEGVKDVPYDIPNLRVEYSRQEPGVQVWFWRSVGHSQNIFFSESFIDELANAAGKDPYEFRRSLLGKQPRYKGVLELAAARAGWGKPLPQGVHRGIAVAQSFGSYVAEVAEVSVDKDGRPKVHRVVAAVDCGQVVNPEIVKRQCESAIVYGLTAALYGKITFKDGQVEQGNFDSYPMLRMSETPKVEVYLVPSKEHATGMGEPGLPALAPAVTAAIFKATGKRIRKLPIDTEALKA